MRSYIVDLHVHSKYSRACSKNLEIPAIAQACVKKGINIISTGDALHPAWLTHLKETLVEDAPGIFKVKDGTSPTRFILGTEVACIYKHRGATRRLHLLLFFPSFETLDTVVAELVRRGYNISSDGRPILGLSAKDLLQLMLDIDVRSVMIPAHAWTPWFAVFGSKSGYDSLTDCFEELTPHIRAIETGLSSDPVMNRRLSLLDDITLISNSDAHGLDNLGREANVLAFENDAMVTYDAVMNAIKAGDKKHFLYTIEFYPEEGKYHADGHAACKVSLAPEESFKLDGLCPVCKKPLTIGVLNRVAKLADRTIEEIPTGKFIPHRYIVPLREVIAQVYNIGVASKKVAAEYERLTSRVADEFTLLLTTPIEQIHAEALDARVADAVDNMRNGNVRVTPGYDGIFGVIEVISKGEKLPMYRQQSLL